MGYLNAIVTGAEKCGQDLELTLAMAKEIFSFIELLRDRGTSPSPQVAQKRLELIADLQAELLEKGVKMKKAELCRVLSDHDWLYWNALESFVLKMQGETLRRTAMLLAKLKEYCVHMKKIDAMTALRAHNYDVEESFSAIMGPRMMVVKKIK